MGSENLTDLRHQHKLTFNVVKVEILIISICRLVGFWYAGVDQDTLKHRRVGILEFEHTYTIQAGFKPKLE